MFLCALYGLVSFSGYSAGTDCVPFGVKLSMLKDGDEIYYQDTVKVNMINFHDFIQLDGTIKGLSTTIGMHLGLESHHKSVKYDKYYLIGSIFMSVEPFFHTDQTTITPLIMVDFNKAFYKVSSGADFPKYGHYFAPDLQIGLKYHL